MYFISSFIGEGNEAIVFGISPVDEPEEEKLVAKILKPAVHYEMTVLHHSLRIHKKRFPNHPLLMAPSERMRRLTEEMMIRIESEGVLFRVAEYSDILMSVLRVLANKFPERFQTGALPDDFLTEIAPPLIDDNLAMKIELLLDEDGFVNGMAPFFEYCLEAIQKWVANAKEKGVYRPLSQDKFFKLLGLHFAGFISWNELLTITNSDRFLSTAMPNDFTNLKSAVAILHYQAPKKDKYAGERSTKQRARFADRRLNSAKTAARYLDAIASQDLPALAHISGYAKNWLARTLLLEGNVQGAITMFEEALAVLTTNESRTERHDALLDLARLFAESDRKRSEGYVLELIEIRKALGLRDDGKR
jgi:tetratricopeptide (TPR) repeat protein